MHARSNNRANMRACTNARASSIFRVACNATPCLFLPEVVPVCRVCALAGRPIFREVCLLASQVGSDVGGVSKRGV
eukprot:1161168-Pelagomonas_calceolata.AAC.3